MQPLNNVNQPRAQRPPIERLQSLADPSCFHEPIDISGESPEFLRRYLESMYLIRETEHCLAKMRKDGIIGGPVHLGVGQEAVAVGVAAHLRRTDRVFGTHRSHSHALAMGSSVHRLFAEVLGKDTGLSRGMGGSMHLWDASNGFFGSVPIVGGTIPIAVGAGLAAKMQGSTDVAVAYFGDGAIEEGVVHESLNLASLLKIPVLFVVENNLFSSHMHIQLRQPLDATCRFAHAHNVAYELVDGNDVVAVSRAAQQLISRSRDGNGPGFLEAVTFRWYGHVDWRDDIDVGVNRSMTEMANWKARDPISRLRAAMGASKMWSEKDDAVLADSVRSTVDRAWQAATADPWPDANVLLDYVYSSGGNNS